MKVHMFSYQMLSVFSPSNTGGLPVMVGNDFPAGRDFVEGRKKEGDPPFDAFHVISIHFNTFTVIDIEGLNYVTPVIFDNQNALTCINVKIDFSNFRKRPLYFNTFQYISPDAF